MDIFDKTLEEAGKKKDLDSLLQPNKKTEIYKQIQIQKKIAKKESSAWLADKSNLQTTDRLITELEAHIADRKRLRTEFKVFMRTIPVWQKGEYHTSRELVASMNDVQGAFWNKLLNFYGDLTMTKLLKCVQHLRKSFK